MTDTILAAVLVAVPFVSQAEVLIYTADLSGAAEDPPVASPGTGFARVDYDDVARTMRVRVDFTGLLAPVTLAHIHGPTFEPFSGNAGVMTQLPTFSGFPAGATSGSYDETFDLTLESSFNAAFVTNNGGTAASAEAALAANLAATRSYLNIHTTEYPAGEIRGFLQLIPEPSTFILLGGGVIGLAGFRSRRRNANSRSACRCSR
ncbi:MAG: CHRD domain-containing protein [Pirellulaceae bacterium]|nr:CHRD domain-containing protein [Pirellulaceae bacterium]